MPNIEPAGVADAAATASDHPATPTIPLSATQARVPAFLIGRHPRHAPQHTGDASSLPTVRFGTDGQSGTLPTEDPAPEQLVHERRPRRGDVAAKVKRAERVAAEWGLR
jgi:hypothetical protein